MPGLTPQEVEAVAQGALSAYVRLPQTGKPAATEHTVLAGRLLASFASGLLVIQAALFLAGCTQSVH